MVYVNHNTDPGVLDYSFGIQGYQQVRPKKKLTMKSDPTPGSVFARVLKVGTVTILLE